MYQYLSNNGNAVFRRLEHLLLLETIDPIDRLDSFCRCILHIPISVENGIIMLGVFKLAKVGDNLKEACWKALNNLLGFIQQILNPDDITRDAFSEEINNVAGSCFDLIKLEVLEIADPNCPGSVFYRYRIKDYWIDLNEKLDMDVALDYGFVREQILRNFANENSLDSIEFIAFVWSL